MKPTGLTLLGLEQRVGVEDSELMAGPADPPSDESLVAATADGDRDAFEQLYLRHAPWLLLRLQHRCADPALVDDVVQDTFLAVWRGARSFAGNGAVAAWIWGIGIRRLVDALRRSPAAAVSLAGVRDPLESSAEEQVLLGIEYGDLGAALNRLSPELRAVVQATILDGLTTKEAARLLRIPHGTVKTRAMRARAALRQELA